jgi:chromosome segregation ATPase
VCVTDAESKARMLLTRLNVLNEDCLTSKKEIGSLQAENIHLEQQLMASQKKLSAAQQSEHTNVLTMKSIQEHLNSAKKEVQESRSKVNQYEAKLHTADNEVYRAKTEMEEERRSTERIREQLSKLNQTQERTVVDIGNKHDNELKQLKAANNVLREQAARATTEALAAAASDDASVVQYKEEVMILKNKLNEKESEHHDVMEQLEQQHRQIIDLEKNNKTSYVQLKDLVFD